MYVLDMTNKKINVNKLQANISKVLRETQKGDVFEVVRYSKTVAMLISPEHYSHLKGDCKKCVQDLRKLVK